MPTKKTIFWILAAGVLYLIAWNIGGGWLYAIIAILIAFPLGSVILSRYNTSAITIEQLSPDRSSQGEDLRTTLVVENSSFLPRYLIRLTCDFAGGSSSMLLVRIEGKSRTSYHMTFSNVRRGIYSGSTLEIASKAPVGLARSRRPLHLSCPMVVYPQWQPLPADWNSGGRSSGYSASSSVPVRSSSSDYLGVREYRPEDSPRSIHWKTSARSDRLAVVEYARQATITPVFLVDPFREAIQGPPEASSFETAVSAAASLIQREAAYNRRFGSGTSLSDAAAKGLGHDPDTAMMQLASLNADADEPLFSKETLTGWPEITPVLIVTSHSCYAQLAQSDLVKDYPDTTVLMIDGRLYADPIKGHGTLLNDEQIARLSDELAAAGCSFRMLSSSKDTARCLEDL
jgi:uncharacterized protein (DUF58 family)